MRMCSPETRLCVSLCVRVCMCVCAYVCVYQVRWAAGISSISAQSAVILPASARPDSWIDQYIVCVCVSVCLSACVCLCVYSIVCQSCLEAICVVLPNFWRHYGDCVHLRHWVYVSVNMAAALCLLWRLCCQQGATVFPRLHAARHFESEVEGKKNNFDVFSLLA